MTASDLLAPRRDARAIRARVFDGLCLLAAFIGVGLLALILVSITRKGIGSVDLNFFTKTPKPVGETGGGMSNAIIGTLIIVGIAALIAVPLGMSAGLYLAESRGNRFATIVRLVADVLTGVPSIIVGILAYQLVVIRMHKFSALAGGIALAALMLPTIVRTTEEIVRLVPREYTEGALALGAPKWRATLTIVVPAAASGLVTGTMLATARAMGETAPLLFTTLGNTFWNTSLTAPMAALPLQIYQYALSPDDDWNRQAWAGALVLVGLTLLLSLLARLAVRKRY